MSSDRRHWYVEIFLLCFAALLLEISYTRLISFKLFYYYTYLIIGFALLGIGAGGVLVATNPRLRTVPLERLLAAGCGWGALAVFVGYFVIAWTPLNAFALTAQVTESAKLLLICAALFASFVAIGIMISALFSRHPEAISRLYCADLLGAGLGCAAAVPLIASIGPPACVFLAGLVLALIGLRLRPRGAPRGTYALSALAAVLALGVMMPSALPDPITDAIKTVRPETHRLFSRWSPVFRIDVSPTADDTMRIIHHDGLWGSGLHRFDGDPASLSRFDRNERAFAFRTLGRPAKETLIIGAAGGHEILAALHFDSARVTAVELNPVTVSLLTDHFADYTGHLASHPRVHLANAEGRHFLASAHEQYDLIYFVAPDSYAAMNSATAGAFVLSESYLYTTEMVAEALGHLTDGGIICMQFGEFAYAQKPNRTARYVGTARQALQRLGIEDFSKHVLVATTRGFLQLSTILLKREPFSREEIDRFLTTVEAVEGSTARHVWGLELDDGAVNKVITLGAADLERWYDTHPYDVRPISDDAPFFWHFTRFRTVIARFDRRRVVIDPEEAFGETVLLIMLGVSGLFAGVFLLLPFVTLRAVWVQLPWKFTSAVYFASLGLGFMLFEICLIQKLTLLLGYPTYSLTVTLLSLLVFTGIGSLSTTLFLHRRNDAARALLLGLLALTLFYQFGMEHVTAALMGTPLAVRVAYALAVLAPLGLCLGAFMPLGLATVSRLSVHGSAYVAWGWAVNGFFSVIGSVLTTILSMNYGFRVVLLLAVAVYAVATWSLRRIPFEPR